ncbi:unnamed protein product [Peniophora sp. CBMAI 1063]|nr:unnamed protein product [Peniophora sp. CBMAI 1063]
MSATKLILYDITSVLSDKAWSRNVWRVRYLLNIKGIQYQTRWLSHPEIEPELKRIGASPTSHWMLKAETYTLPVMYDASKKTVLSDSNTIAAYLEETFPETRSLRVAQSIEFVQSFGARLNESLFPLLVAPTAENLLPETRAAWRTKREKAYGTTLEAMAEPDTKRAELLKVVDDELSYRDVAIAATLINARRVGGADSDIWRALMEAHEGRWRELMSHFAQWEAVDVGIDSSCTGSTSS